jgi:arsenite methyltransferase
MLILLLLVFAPALAAQTPHQHHPPSDAKEYARVLEDPSRDAWQKPHEVITALNLKPTDVVADIGSGSGYFTRRLARHAAKVFAVDIDPELLKMAAKNAPANVETVLATASDPKLPPSSVDVVFFCNVLHHIDNRPQYYAKLKAALKPGGRLVDIDFYKKETPVGPPVSMKLSQEQVISELTAAGFRLGRKAEFLPYQYFLEFRPD